MPTPSKHAAASSLGLPVMTWMIALSLAGLLGVACGGEASTSVPTDGGSGVATSFPTTDATTGLPTGLPTGDAVADASAGGASDLGPTDTQAWDGTEADDAALDGNTPAADGSGAADAPDEIVQPPVPECMVDLDCEALGVAPVCQRWACNPGAGQCVTVALPVGTTCDSTVCKTNQVCQAGACVGGSPIPCDDGDPCTDDGCDAEAGCTFVESPDCCIPECAGKFCGDDGCGGVCGTCQEDWTCAAEGVCVHCTPSCAGLSCGDDGCGGSCGLCPDTWSCKPPGVCEPCEPQCLGKVCGDDGCGGICGSCASGFSCNELGQCFGCSPDCSGKSCGDDGCGASCGACEFGDECSAGKCICASSCGGKECGDDGCGASCGGCPAGETCSPGFVCVAQATGDSCVNPFEVDVVPFSATGTTVGGSNDLAISSWGCGGSGDGPYGGASPDHVYRFVPPQDDTYDIMLETSAALAVYVVVDCVDPDGGCVAVDALAPISTGLPMQAGAEHFIVVDGASNDADVSGDYTLTITGESFGGCVPECAGKECGANGCGGNCGICSGNLACSPSGECVPGTAGDVCELPFIVDGVPFVAVGDTSDATADYGYSKDACPGESSAHGAGSKDDVFLFSPVVSGNYLITLTGDFDNNLYVVADCTDVDGSCLGASESATSLGVESLVLFLAAGESYFVIVDGFSSLIDFSGTYVLTVDAYDDGGCEPGCAGKECGSDGCGGQCGACGAGEACLAAACVDAGAGDTCSDPFVIDDVPFEAVANTTNASADYHYEFGVCPGEVGGWGEGGSDHVYAFTPIAAGEYTIILDASFDGTIYVATDCVDLQTSCVGAVEDTIGTETLVLTLDAFTSYLIFVDYYSNSLNDTGEYTLKVSGPG